MIIRFVSISFSLSIWQNQKLSTKIYAINPFQPSVVFHIETSHLICNANRMTGFYMKCNTGLKCVKLKPSLNFKLMPDGNRKVTQT